MITTLNPDDPKTDTQSQLDALAGLFYDAQSLPGTFTEVAVNALSETAAKLLAHDHHMTVALEQHHGCLVDVHVLESRVDGDRYSRKIKLTRQSDGAAVLFGIVRLDRNVLADHVRAKIEDGQTPLGRVLIENDVLREVKLIDLFQIQATGELAEAFAMESGDVCFGRTAMIYCDGAPAIELLEIVSA